MRQRIAAATGVGGGDSPVLKEALAELYLADGQRERALALHLELGRPAVLDFIARHGRVVHSINILENCHATLFFFNPQRLKTCFYLLF